MRPHSDLVVVYLGSFHMYLITLVESKFIVYGQEAREEIKSASYRFEKVEPWFSVRSMSIVNCLKRS